MLNLGEISLVLREGSFDKHGSAGILLLAGDGSPLALFSIEFCTPYDFYFVGGFVYCCLTGECPWIPFTGSICGPPSFEKKVSLKGLKSIGLWF
jgi:hypothetical protein